MVQDILLLVHWMRKITIIWNLCEETVGAKEELFINQSLILVAFNGWASNQHLSQVSFQITKMLRRGKEERIRFFFCSVSLTRLELFIFNQTLIYGNGYFSFCYVCSADLGRYRYRLLQPCVNQSLVPVFIQFISRYSYIRIIAQRSFHCIFNALFVDTRYSFA